MKNPIDVGIVQPGETVTINLLIKAPMDIGEHDLVYQLEFNSQFFGPQVTVCVVVAEIERK